MRRFLIPFCIILVGIITYLPSFQADFLWDDEDFVLNNQYVIDGKFDKFFTAQAVEGAGKVSNYFRPIQFSLYSLLYKISGPSPLVFHTANILVHSLAAIALYYFLSSLSIKKFHRLAITGLFLIHPIQTEAVSYVSGLSDPLVALFGFTSLALFTHAYLLSLLFYILSLGSKESGLIFLGVIVILPLIIPLKNKLTHHLARLLPFFFVTLLYLLYHRTAIEVIDMAKTWGDHVYASNVFIRLATFLSLLPTYLQILLFPKTLFYDRDFTVSLASSPWHLPAVIILNLLSLILFLLCYSFYHSPTPNHRLRLFSFLGFFIAFIPFSGLLLINGIMYEHFLYVPLVFFFLFLSSFINSPATRLFVVLNIGIFLLLFARSWIRQYDWQTPESLYLQTLTFAPNSYRVWNNLGSTYEKQNQYDKAKEAYTTVITLHPTLPNGYHNLANLYVKGKEYAQAEQLYQKAIAVDPTFGYSYTQLAKLYEETGETEKLQKILQQISTKFQQ